MKAHIKHYTVITKQLFCWLAPRSFISFTKILVLVHLFFISNITRLLNDY